MHIDDKILEQFVFFPESISDTEKSKIICHLDECVSCKDAYNIFEKIYCDLDEEILKEPTDNDKDLAIRIKTKFESREQQKLLMGHSSSVRIYDGKAEIMGKQNIFALQNIYYFIKNYPLPSFGFAIIASLAIAFISVTVKNQFKDLNPISLDNKHGIIQVFNKEGELIWNKYSGSKSGNENIDSLMYWAGFAERRYINLLDVDGDGKNEVLLTGFGESKIYSEDSLYCFNNDGTLRWTISPEDQRFNYAPKWHRTHWYMADFFNVKTRSGPKFFVIAHVKAYGGTVVSEINPINGSVTSSIYHSGQFSTEACFDIDNDGDDEMLLGATSSFDQSALMILKANYLMGVMPEINLSMNTVKGNALYYLLLPLSKVGKIIAADSPPNIAMIKKMVNGGTMVLSNDHFIKYNKTMQLVFVFDSTFACTDVTMGNSYAKTYDELLKKGVLKKPFNDYKKELIDSIKYWDGDKFVHYPTKNKYWNQKFALPSK